MVEVSDCRHVCFPRSLLFINQSPQSGGQHPFSQHSQEWSSVKLGGGMREEERRGVTLFLDKGRDRER